MTKKSKESKITKFETAAIERYMFGDLFVFFESNLTEEARRKENPFIEIGKNTKIKTGAMIGGDGFGYEGDDHKHRTHRFKVIIGDNVDIGNGVTIDRGRWRDTEIGNNTKIDNLAHIAHNVIIGENCYIHAHTNICGSVEIGNNCEIYPLSNIQVGIKICDGVTIGDGSIVREDITEAGTYVYAGNGKMRKIK